MIVDISYDVRLTFSAASLIECVAMVIYSIEMMNHLGKGIEYRTTSDLRSQNLRVAIGNAFVISIDPIIMMINS